MQDDSHVLEDLQAALSVEAKGEDIPDKCTGLFCHTISVGHARSWL